MNKGGRPRKEIDWEDFDKLCGIQCTQEEIAAWFGVSVDTIERAVKRKFKKGFAEFFKQKKQKGKISLRRVMYQKAQDGNTTMLIWLSKNYLGMTDKIETFDNEELVYKTPESMKPD